jgi:putative salt-induced outer membrane protein
VTKLDVEAGAGFRQTELRLTGESDDDVIARGALSYEHKLTATTLIYDRFLVEAGGSNTFPAEPAWHGSEDRGHVGARRRLRRAAQHRRAPRHREHDQVFTVNLVYGFK